MKKYTDDILVTIGTGFISVGAFFIHVSVGFIVTGALFIAAAYLLARGGDSG